MDQGDLENFNMEEIIRKAAKQELLRSSINNTEFFDIIRNNDLSLTGGLGSDCNAARHFNPARTEKQRVSRR